MLETSLQQSRTILLSGPAGYRDLVLCLAELYQQMLAKALAHFSEAKLLLLDVTDFVLKIQSKYGVNNESSIKRSTSETTLERLSGFLGSCSIRPAKEDPRGSPDLLKTCSADLLLCIKSCQEIFTFLGCMLSLVVHMMLLVLHFSHAYDQFCSSVLKRTSSWSIDEKQLIQSLYNVLYLLFSIFH